MTRVSVYMVLEALLVISASCVYGSGCVFSVFSISLYGFAWCLMILISFYMVLDGSCCFHIILYGSGWLPVILVSLCIGLHGSK